MKKFFYSLLLLLIGAFIGYYVDLYKSYEQGRIRYIDQETDILNSVLNLPAMPGQKLQIFLNNTEIQNVTKVKVSLSNFEDKDFSDIPLFITLTPKEGDTIDVITKDFYVGESKSRDRISELTKIHQPIKKEAIKFGFKINTLNRRYNYEDRAIIEFYLRGNIDPEVKLAINKAGVELRPYSFDHWDQLRPVSAKINFVVIIALFVVFIFGYSYLSWYLLKKGQKRLLRKKQSDIDYINERLINEFKNESINPDLGGRLLYELEVNEYRNLSKIGQLINSEPKIEDFVTSDQNSTIDNNTNQG